VTALRLAGILACNLVLRPLVAVCETLARGIEALGVGEPDPIPPEDAQVVRDQSSEQALTNARFRAIMRAEYPQETR
jgi:hypothetical protein